MNSLSFWLVVGATAILVFGWLVLRRLRVTRPRRPALRSERRRVADLEHGRARVSSADRELSRGQRRLIAEARREEELATKAREAELDAIAHYKEQLAAAEIQFMSLKLDMRVADRAIRDKLERLVARLPQEYRVWFGTNRKPVDASDPSRGFSGARDKTMHYGHCDVFVPESHKIGSVGSSWIKRLLTLTDDRLKLRRLGVLGRADYWRALGRQLAKQAPGERHAVVFLHGYNVSFEQAAIRAAQIGFDLGVGGAMAFFSWPSRGKTGQYIADGASIEASEAAIADFLADFGRESGADIVHVIAHSMGNRGLLRAINRIFADAERRSGCQFGEFILAAPDVDADTFGQLAGAYREMAARTTLYVSGRDRAVGLSKWIHDYPRVGFEPPLSIFDGIDTISVTNVDLSILGHGYVAEARPVLTDMHAIIFRRDPPEKRAFLKERKTDRGQRYWEVRG